MYFKVGQIKPFAVGKEVTRGRIIKVDLDNKTYTLEELDTKKIYVVDENNVFIGDD